MDTQSSTAVLDNNTTSIITSLHGYEAQSTSAQEGGFSGYSEAQSLSDFISKPRLIGETDVSSGSLYAFSPLQLLLTSQVMKRLMYFKRLRGNIKVQFICNPNVYDAGIIMANVSYDMVGTTIPSVRAYVQNLFTKTHVLMDLGSQTTGELTFPLNYTIPYLDITKPIPAGDATVTLSTFTPNITNVTTGAASTVNVKIYACIEDAEISGPVHFGSNVVYTASKSKDAEIDLVSDGAISFPASIIANIGRRLKDVPVIGPFAYASGIIATGIAKMAILFGYSRPQIMTDIPYPHVEDYASYAGPIRLKGLTLDPLQEIPIGTTHLGTKDDPLSFNSLISREGIIAELQWQTTSPNGTRIAAINVSPTTCTQQATGFYSHTPLSYVSSMFTAYRGSIILEIYIAANRYNNGKLRLSFVPQDVSYSTELASLSQNALTTVVDLSVSTKISFTLPYLKIEPYSPILPSKGYTTNRASTDIGMLLIHVESQLRNQGNVPLDIIVTSRAGPDFELHLPQTTLTSYLTAIPYDVASTKTWTPTTVVLDRTPVAKTFTDTIKSNGENWAYSMQSSAIDPVMLSSVAMDKSIETDTPALVMMGEKFTSLRPLLKRFYHHTEIAIEADSIVKLPSLPRLGPLTFYPLTSTYATPNVVNHPITIATLLYRGFTGSIRVMIIPNSPSFSSLTVARDYEMEDYTDVDTLDTTFNNTPNGNAFMLGTGECTFYKGEPIIFRVPYQGKYQYHANRPFSSLHFGATMVSPGFTLQATYDSGSIGTFKIYYAIDEDFQPCVWNGVPPLFQYSVPLIKASSLLAIPEESNNDQDADLPPDVP